MDYIINKFNLNSYYSFFDIIKNIHEYNITNYYTNEYTRKINIIRNNSNKIVIYNSNNRLTWLDYNNKYNIICLCLNLD